MDTKNIIVSALVVVSVVFGVLAFKAPTVVSVPTQIKFDASSLGSQKAPVVNVSVPEQKAPIVNVNVPKQTSTTLGSVSSPVLPYKYLSVGGITRFFEKTSALTSATTTVCALASPAATSTLIRGTVRFDVSSTTASRVTLAKATTPYATTTALGATNLAANAQGTLNASTTLMVSTLDDTTVFAPNTYFVVGMADGTAEATAGTFSPSGVCQATFEAI